MEVVFDGGFEDNELGNPWSHVNGERVTDRVFEGAHAVKLEELGNPLSELMVWDQSGQVPPQWQATIPISSIPLNRWVLWQVGSFTFTDETWLFVGTIKSADGNPASFVYQFTDAAGDGLTLPVSVRVYVEQNGPDHTVWIDNVTTLPVEDRAMVTNAMKDAIETDLNTVSGLTVYVDKPVRRDETKKPAASVFTGGFERANITEDEGISMLHLTSVQQFAIRVDVESDTPSKDMNDLLDEIRNALERCDSEVRKLGVVARVFDVEVTSDPFTLEAGQDIEEQIQQRDINLRVLYLYAVGAL